MNLGHQRGYLYPLSLVIIALLVIVVWNGLRLEQDASSTPTPTKTPDPRSAAQALAVEAFPADSASRAAGAAGQVSPRAIPTWTSSPTLPASPTWSVIPTVTLLPSLTPSSSPTAAPTAFLSSTPARVPTFTPPPQGSLIAGELDHYWLERPIPPDYANWTDRIYPYGSTLGGTLSTHHGVEFFNPVGVPVLAAGSGVVVTAGSDQDAMFGPQTNFYGNLVVIRHQQPYQEQAIFTVYGHLSQVLVTEGQAVNVGDLVGLVGGTGVANGGAHLHFEVRVGENSYQMTRNPELWLRPYPGWGTLAGQLLWPDGSYVYEAPLLLRRADDPTRFVNRSIYTYADDSVNPDDGWRENFSSPDLEPGPYEIIFQQGDMVYRELVWIYPNQTSFVTIQLGAQPGTDSSSP